MQQANGGCSQWAVSLISVEDNIKYTAQVNFLWYVVRIWLSLLSLLADVKSDTGLGF